MTSRGAATENVGLTPPGGNSGIKTHNFEDGVGLTMTCFFGQLFDSEPEERVDPIRDELGGWFEGETSLVQSRVGEVEIGTSAHRRSRDEKVEIENSGSPPFFLCPVATGNHLELSATME